MRRRHKFAAAAVAVTAGGAAAAALTFGGGRSPDLRPPAGAYNPNVNQANISTTICVPGWTATVRPPTSYTDGLKLTQIRSRHLADMNPRDYEEDHFIPLELGGDPMDPLNLWPQILTKAHEKDRVENQLRSAVCAGQMTLMQARQEVIVGW